MSILDVIIGAIILGFIQAVWRALRHSRKATLNEWAGATLELLGPEQKAFDPATATNAERMQRWYRYALELWPEQAWEAHMTALIDSAVLHTPQVNAILAEMETSK